MFGRIIILGAEALVYYKSVTTVYKIAKNTLKLFRVFRKNKPEEVFYKTDFVE